MAEMEVDIMEMEKKSLYINHDLCKACGGKCCLHSGCSYSPTDFGTITLARLKEKLESGLASIVAQFDIFEDGVSYHLAIRSRNLDRGIVDLFSAKNTCCALGENGCTFSDDERPYGGISLVPKENFQCENLYSDQIAYKEWLPYQKLLERLVRLYTNMGSSEKLREDIIQAAYLLTYQHTVLKDGKLVLHTDNLNQAEQEILDTLNVILPTYKEEVELGMSKAKNKLLKK